MNKHYGKCQYPGGCKKNQSSFTPRIRVVIDGKIRMLCKKHGPSTEAMVDIIKKDRRIRIIAWGPVFNLYRYTRNWNIGEDMWDSDHGKDYKHYKSALDRGLKFLNA